MVRSTGTTRLRGAALAFGCLCAGLAGAQSHRPDPMFHDGFQGVAAGPFNDADAARFLAQATFGVTTADIAHLRAIGYDAWLEEQFDPAQTPPTHHLAYTNWVSGTLHEPVGTDTLREAWLLGALGGPDPANNAVIHKDQLRQRLAFALSEIFVVSEENTMLSQFPTGLAWYYDLLVDNAFGDYRQLLEQVTLSPAMGVYLNMQGNRRADLSVNRHPDENYAREINQLFSIGLVMLNPDGTVILQNGVPKPTYDQSTITNFAHVFTGWNWFDCPPNNFSGCGADYTTGLNFRTPLAPFAAQHDNGTDPVNDFVTKQLLKYTNAANNGVLASGGTPQSDLTFALDNIANHPNVGPFIGKQLIQRLVTSNPSPAYVARVTAVWNDDQTAQHKRGNLRAVVKQILLDPEARLGQWQQPDSFGKLREPLLRLTHFWRAMHAVHYCGTDYVTGAVTHHFANQPYRYAGYSTAYGTNDTHYGNGVAQAPLDADTVFNFFKPSYMPSGEMTTRNLLGPEYQILTDTILTNSSNALFGMTFGQDTASPCNNAQIGEIKVDRTLDYALAGSANGGGGDPAAPLIDAYDLRFMSGQMSPFMRQTLLNVLNPIGIASGANWKTQRINRALLLILTSPEYMIQK